MSTDTISAILREAYATYKPSHIFYFVSGGYDSTVAAFYSWEWMRRIIREGGAGSGPGEKRVPTMKFVHFNTGIGVPETRLYVYKLQYMFNWPFAEYRSPIRYQDIVQKHGFPGPSSHRYMYIQLKERSIDQMMRDHSPRKEELIALFLEVLKSSRAMPLLYQRYLYAALLEEYRLFKEEQKQKALFITGVRSTESLRRMGHVKPIQVEGKRVWVAPLVDWTKADVMDAMQGLPGNPVVDLLHGSKECLCGAYAKQGELGDICFWYPATGRYIRELEQIVRASGFVWGWEDAPPSWWRQMRSGQLFLPGMEPDDQPEVVEPTGSGIATLCSSCDARYMQEQKGCGHDERTCAGCAITEAMRGARPCH